jgi:flagellar biosynthesis protein FlhG
MLMDADLGLANVDVLLGLKTEYNLSHVLAGHRSLSEIIAHDAHGLMVVPAASGIQRMAQLSSTEYVGLINAFSEFDGRLDALIVDTSAGINDSVVRFSRAASDVLVVVCDEPASLTDAYALIKVLSRDHGIDQFHMLSNMVGSAIQGRDLFNKLVRVTNRFLDVALDYAGAIPADKYLREAVQKQQALVHSFPRSPSALAFNRLARKVETWLPPKWASGHLEFFFDRLVANTVHSGAVQ